LVRTISYTLTTVYASRIINHRVTILNTNCFSRTMLQTSCAAGTFAKIQQH